MSTLKLSNSSSDEGYARSLRAIGRNLAEKFPENLEIEVIGTAFKARFDVRAKASPVAKPSKSGMLQKLFSKPANAPTESTAAPTAMVAEVRIFNTETIDAIYAKQISARKETGGNPDIYDLGERLRTIGRVVEQNHGKLIHLSKNAQSISFQYADENGEIHNEELSNQNLFRLQQEYHDKRINTDGDVWESDAR